MAACRQPEENAPDTTLRLMGATRLLAVVGSVRPTQFSINGSCLGQDAYVLSFIKEKEASISLKQLWKKGLKPWSWCS